MVSAFYFRSKSTIIPLWRWEVLPEQVVFKEEIGRGAFGKVLKGTYKESPGIEVFYEPRTQIVDFKAGLTVAIKVLGGMWFSGHKNSFINTKKRINSLKYYSHGITEHARWDSEL